MIRVKPAATGLCALVSILLLAVSVLVSPTPAFAVGPCAGEKFPDGPFCYSCRGGNRTGEPITSDRACSYWSQPRQSMVQTGVSARFGFICPAGQWPSGGSCYACPSGWLGTPFVPPTAPIACWKPGQYQFAAAVRDDTPYCGTQDTRPCTIWEAMPSCAPGLFEYQGACRPVPPGKSPFLATIELWAKDTAKSGKEACTAAILGLPSPPEPFPLISSSFKSIYDLDQNTSFKDIQNAGKSATNDAVRDGAICAKNYQAGFVCSVPGMLSSIGNSAEMLDRFGHAFDKPPCTVYRDANAPTLYLACAVAESLGVTSAVELAKCAVDALRNSPEKTAEQKLAQLCKARGQLTFEVAKSFAGKKMTEVLQANASERVVLVAQVLSGIYSAMGRATSLETVKDMLAKTGSCQKFNDPVQTPASSNVSLPVAQPVVPTPVSTAPPPVPVAYQPLVTSQNSILQIANVWNPRCMTQRSTDQTQFYVDDCKDGDEAQSWVVERRDGFFTLRSQQSWQCLTHGGGGSQVGNTTVQTPCDILNENQRWAIRPVANTDSAFSLSPFNNRGLCLATQSGDNNASVPYETCDYKRTPQQWQLRSFGSLRRAMLEFAQDGRCMAQGGSFEDSRQVFQWDCGNGSDRSNWTWMLEPYPGQEGFYYLRNETSGKCLDLKEHRADRTAPIQQYTCSKNNAGQIWELAQTGSGQYALQLRTYLYQDARPRHCVALKDNGKGNNVPFWQWPCSAGNDYGQYGKNDKFRLNFVQSKSPIWVEWTSTGAFGLDIAVGGSEQAGYWAWAIGSDQKVYRWSGSGWDLMGGGGASRIDVGPDGNAVAIGWQSTIWGWDPGRKDFVQIPGKAVDITVSADNHMYMISAEDRQIYQWSAGQKSWVPSGFMQTRAQQYRDIDADPFGNVFALTEQNVLYTLQKNGRVDIGGLAEPVSSSIGTSPDGAIWATGIDGSVSQYLNAAESGWQILAHTGGMRFVRIEGSVRGWVWAIRDDGTIFYGEVL